jgi:hypothetical protein
MGSLEQVNKAVSAWQSRRDNLNAKVNWQFTYQDAREDYGVYIRHLMCDVTIALNPVGLRERSSASRYQTHFGTLSAGLHTLIISANSGMPA